MDAYKRTSLLQQICAKTNARRPVLILKSIPVLCKPKSSLLKRYPCAANQTVEIGAFPLAGACSGARRDPLNSDCAPISRTCPTASMRASWLGPASTCSPRGNPSADVSAIGTVRAGAPAMSGSKNVRLSHALPVKRMQK